MDINQYLTIRFSAILQFVLISLVTILIMLIIKQGIQPEESIWLTACSGIMFFAFINPIISIFQKNWLSYFILSVISFLFSIIGLLFSAKIISGHSINEFHSFKMIVISAILFFILATILARLLKEIFKLTVDNL